MEEISRKFFEDDSLLALEMGPDGVVGFMVSNYPQILGTYRAIEKQNHLTAIKKENAQKELNALRQIHTTFVKKSSQVKDEDWRQLNEKMEYWKEVREEDDVVYYKGEPIRFNSYVEFIMKYTSIVEAVSVLDSAARQPLGRGASFVGKVATWPLKKVVLFAVMCCGMKGVGKDIAAAIYAILDSVPAALEQRIANIDPGITSGSNDVEIDSLRLIEVKVTDKD